MKTTTTITTTNVDPTAQSFALLFRIHQLYALMCLTFGQKRLDPDAGNSNFRVWSLNMTKIDSKTCSKEAILLIDFKYELA